MKKKGVKASGHSKSRYSLINRQIRQEIALMHKATSEFVDLCIDAAKLHPTGLDRIRANIERISATMKKLDKLYASIRG